MAGLMQTAQSPGVAAAGSSGTLPRLRGDEMQMAAKSALEAEVEMYRDKNPAVRNRAMGQRKANLPPADDWYRREPIVNDPEEDTAIFARRSIRKGAKMRGQYSAMPEYEPTILSATPEWDI